MLGIRALASDNRTYAFASATVTVRTFRATRCFRLLRERPRRGSTLRYRRDPGPAVRLRTRINGTGAIPPARTASRSRVRPAIRMWLRRRTSVRRSVPRRPRQTPAGPTTAQAAATAVVSGTFSITTTSLPDGTKYDVQHHACGERRDNALHLVGWDSGTLPAGLSLAASTGVISGTPTAAGTSSFTVKLTDNNSQNRNAGASASSSTPVQAGLHCRNRMRCRALRWPRRPPRFRAATRPGI